MAAFDAPVCLTRTAPHDAYSGQLVIYDVVDASAINRSEVLSCIFEASGEVVLPEDIRLPDFKRWMAAIKHCSKEATSMSFSSKCIVLKVADALGDAKVDDWIQLAARDLSEQARDHQQSTKCAPEHVAEILCSIPVSLQQCLLAAAAPQPSQLHALLDFLPGHLHPAVVAATVTPTKMLEAPLNDHSLPFIRALVSMPAEPPSFLSLHVLDGLDDSNPHPMKCPALQEAAPVLAEALRHHTAISQLSITLDCTDPASAGLLAPAIATLKSLQSLHLCTHINQDTTHTLGQTLTALPRLQDLSLFLMYVSASSKRPREDEPTASCSLTDMLAPATQLTSLTLSISADSHTRCFAATSRLVLPHLIQLKADYEYTGRDLVYSPSTFCRSLAAIAFFVCLTAPLTTLILQSRHRHNESLGPDNTASAHSFYLHLGQFSQLKRLRLPALLDECHEFQFTQVEDSGVARAPRALARMRHLNDLDITACSRVLRAVLARPPGGAAACSLTRLRLMCLNRDDRQSDVPAQQPSATWRAILGALSNYRLESLALELQNRHDGTLPGLAALGAQGLPQLTALRTENWECLRSTADLPALACMTCMQRLHLVASNVPRDLHRGAVRTLQQLPALTSLMVRCGKEPEEFANALAADEAPPHAWPALRELSIDVWDDQSLLDAVLRLAATRPALTRLAFDQDMFSVPGEESASGEDSVSGEEGRADGWEGIEASAAAAGATVSFEWDFPF